MSTMIEQADHIRPCWPPSSVSRFIFHKIDSPDDVHNIVAFSGDF